MAGCGTTIEQHRDRIDWASWVLVANLSRKVCPALEHVVDGLGVRPRERLGFHEADLLRACQEGAAKPKIIY